MSALKIYGVARSRAFRTLWMAGELGLDWEHVPVDLGETRSPSYLKINPNGHIPAIDDGGFVLWESMAINLYLAKKYGSGADGLYPSRLEDEARTWQWSFWGMAEVERPLLTALFNRAIYPEEKRDAAAAAAAEKSLAAPFAVLDGALAESPYLLGARFTVADLNVAGILTWVRPAAIDLSAAPRLASWLKACLDRPAARAARQLQR
ncbi:MAG TPA: glutathione S-transferase family protein [Stellaceae bacterium]|nr:glutathione S-transferase family protein [Stellaceae bacterium]